MAKKKTLYLIDGAGFYYRAFYAIKGNLKTADGTPTNAVYGFARMFMKIIREKKPDYLAIAFDSKEKTFRHHQYADYKANREKVPEDLNVQVPLIEKLVAAFNIAVIKQAGLEADDLMGSAARLAKQKGLEVVLVSGDKDLMQLVEEGVSMLDPLKDKLIDPAGVEEKFGVPPGKVPDFLGLMGDSSDNIPGVPGVGQKTALKLLQEHGDMEAVLKNAEEIKKPKLRQSLTDYADQARLSRELATIKTDVDLEEGFKDWIMEEPDREALALLFRELGFKSMLEEMGDEAPPPPQQIKGIYKAVTDATTLNALVQDIKKAGAFAVDTETTSTEPMRAELVGVSLCCKEGEAWYIPVAHDYDGAQQQLEKADVIKALKPLLENEKIEKYGHNIKYDLLVLDKEGVDIGPLSFDTMLASYLLSAEERRHSLSALAKRYLDHIMSEYADVAGKGAKQVTFNKVELEPATDYAAEDADMTFRLTAILRKEVAMEKVDGLLRELEMPLVCVIAGMEKAGIKLDAAKLEEYGRELEKKIEKLEKDIHKAAGEEFNVNSPKQLSEIMFDKLGLRKVKKTKTGASTDQSVLETLADDHPLPALVLQHRTLSKLRSTYVEPLPRLMLSDGRVHSSFNQAMAATGRLSSSNPNLQNIPVRSEEGRRIRQSFIAEEGCRLISADYSQIELRLLAHLTGDTTLTEAFKKDEDIHARTARELFGKLAGDDGQSRAIAKAVNFSIIYGKTAFGLARDLRIPRAEAAQYIEDYYRTYQGVFDFVEEVKETARTQGYVQTMFGRKRYLPDITSRNRTLRDAAERQAVNSVVQGSAADLIKRAMLRTDKALARTGARLLLQVHDELIFEVPEKESATAARAIEKAMEEAAELTVPLKVTVTEGKTWGELH